MNVPSMLVSVRTCSPGSALMEMQKQQMKIKVIERVANKMDCELVRANLDSNVKISGHGYTGLFQLLRHLILLLQLILLPLLVPTKASSLIRFLSGCTPRPEVGQAEFVQPDFSREGIAMDRDMEREREGRRFIGVMK